MTGPRTPLAYAHVVRWCAEECERQQVGPLRVADMFDGWRYARLITAPLRHDDIVELGRIIEPTLNRRDGYRSVGVRVGASIKPPAAEVPDLMTRLLEIPGDDDPVGWFRQYEEIHPFVDGNGRTGAILLNWWAGTLDRPTTAHNLWPDELVADETPIAAHQLTAGAARAGKSTPGA